MVRSRWENGLGETGRDGRELRNKYGVVIADRNGEPVAIAGVFDTFGMSEIGVDNGPPSPAASSRSIPTLR
ncbi:MAG: hypothetical protein ABI782_03595 [Anaerolineaceae bacterium]